MRTALLGLASAALALAISAQQHVFADADAPVPRVNVSLHVMSRCPDARLCESVFEDVLQTRGIWDKVALDMHYVAEYMPHHTPPVSCKHGPLECAGNAHQLCARAHLSPADFYAVLSCMNYGEFPGSIGDAALVERCVGLVGAEWAPVGKCIAGKRGKGRGGEDEEEGAEQAGPASGAGSDEDDGKAWWAALGPEASRRLVRNVRETNVRNVTRSCTIHIDSTLVRARRRVCVVDGGVWSGCDDGHTAADFVRVIEEEWDNLQSRK